MWLCCHGKLFWYVGCRGLHGTTMVLYGPSIVLNRAIFLSPSDFKVRNFHKVILASHSCGWSYV